MHVDHDGEPSQGEENAEDCTGEGTKHERPQGEGLSAFTQMVVEREGDG